MDNKTRASITDNKKYATMLQNEIKQEVQDTFLTRKDTKKSIHTDSINDEKDLLIAQLQDQIAKQRECISHYESIVQLMNYRLMKLKKVLKAHQLLGELD